MVGGPNLVRVSCRELLNLAYKGYRRAGFSAPVSETLAQATLEAEQYGKHIVGLAHLPHYVEAAQRNLVNVAPAIENHMLAPSMLSVDADSGPMQYAFTETEADFISACRTNGLAGLWLNNAFSGGELGFVSRRLARHGLISICAANSPAVMSVGHSKHRLLGTNPLSYGIPISGHEALIIDQASSATALAMVEKLADEDRSMPDGWALDAHGAPTNDAASALEGALLPFGGFKGGNIALLVEFLAMLGGANSSLEAAPFYSGESRPDIGVCVLAIDTQQLGSFADRVKQLVSRFRDEFDAQIRTIELQKTGNFVEVLADDWNRITNYVGLA